jgi:dienelactone hydrolase
MPGSRPSRLLAVAVLLGCGASTQPAGGAAPDVPGAPASAASSITAPTEPAASAAPSATITAPRTLPLPCPAPDRPLGATLWLPATGAGPFPTAIVLVGAQPWNRDGDLPGRPWHHYADLADAIARAGGAALLFDKGGTGVTGGAPADLDQRAREAVAAIACARARPEVDPGRLVLVGHSEGSEVALEVALGGAPIAGLVLLSPVVLPAGLARLPPVPVTLVRGEADGGDDADRDRMAALGARGRHVLVPGGDHLLFDTRTGPPDPADPATTIAPAAARAVVEAVVGGGRREATGVGLQATGGGGRKEATGVGLQATGREP